MIASAINYSSVRTAASILSCKFWPGLECFIPLLRGIYSKYEVG